MAHKKAGGSSKNGRDSNAKRLGVKRFGGQVVKAGEILFVKEEQIHILVSMLVKERMILFLLKLLVLFSLHTKVLKAEKLQTLFLNNIFLYHEFHRRGLSRS